LYRMEQESRRFDEEQQQKEHLEETSEKMLHEDMVKLQIADKTDLGTVLSPSIPVPSRPSVSSNNIPSHSHLSASCPEPEITSMNSYPSRNYGNERYNVSFEQISHIYISRLFT
jgi:hypothetical protein